MSQPTMTMQAAMKLYRQGLAYFGDYGIMTTRTASYIMNAEETLYIRHLSGLRVVHQHGVSWNGTRFVRCACDHCQRHAEEASTVRVYEGAL